MSAASGSAPRGRLIAAFAAVYVVWGSTYLAIRFAVDTIPPFLMAGTRFLLSGAILWAWARTHGAPRPSRREWRVAFVVGTLLLFGGNGAVVWAEQRVPSGLAALLVAVVPLWMVLLDWLRPGGTRPRSAVFAGLALGLVGLGLLVGPGALSGGRSVDPMGAAVLMAGAFSWAVGSLVSKRGAHPDSPILTTGMQMIAGGLVLSLAALVSGEASAFAPAAVTTRSLLGWAYLVTFGSLIGFTAYIYMLRHTTPARAATYAYVNPVVAVLLGWAFANEPVTMRTLVAAAVILAGVAIISVVGGGTAKKPDESERRLPANDAEPARPVERARRVAGG